MVVRSGFLKPLALVFARIPRLLPAIVLAHAVLSFPPVVRLYADPHAWRLRSFPWRAALRLEPEEAWLRRNFPGYSVARLIEDKVAASGAVFSFNQVAEAYTSRRVLVAYESALGQLLGGILWTPVVPDYQPVKRFEFPVDTEPHRIVRVVQTAEAAPDQWNVTEMRVFLRGAEIPRSPAWRVRAWPNIWEAPLAFDNSPVTSWGSARPAAPLMSIEIDFGSPVKLDTVRLDCPLGQHRIRMRLETQDAEGRWSYQGAPAIETDAPPPPGLRRYVALEFLSRGVTHLLVQDTDFFADDFRRNAAEWRLAVEGELPGVRLYRFR